MALRRHTYAFRPAARCPNNRLSARPLSAGCFERAKKAACTQ
ncbi:hypothetical protein [Kingella denitrificans]|nr:hypothetical protein [Kingella denitrificans]